MSENNFNEENIEQQNEQQTPKESKFVTELISWIKTIVFAFIFAWLITHFIIVNAVVPTGSMENTIMPGDRLVANRLSYAIGDPERFDIVVFKYPDDEEKLFVKRIIGLPGETVEIKNNNVYINGSEEPLENSFVKEEMYGDFGPYEVPEGHYFMMGDNRNNSRDSRYWTNQYVREDKILGKVLVRYWPTPAYLANK